MTLRRLLLDATLAVLGALALPGCPGNTTLDASRYQTTCVVDSDCVAVFMGDICSACTCHNDAISTSSRGRYNGDVGGIAPWCPQNFSTCGACPTVTAGCDAGQCQVVTP
jgi:hypothetical protein